MKNIYLIIGLILIFNACKSQNNKTMEHFDVKKFEQHRVAPYEDNAEYTKEDGTRIYMMSNGVEGFDMFEYPPHPSLYEYFKSFHKNTHLKMSVKRVVRGNVILGIVNEYDENGKVIKTTDYDKPFTYSWEDIQKYCKDNSVDILSNKTFISRNCSENKCKWEIKYSGQYKGKYGNVITIILDGKSGELLKIICQNGKGGEGTTVETIYDKEQEIKKSSSIYKTYEGKDYTKEEWVVFEQEQYNEHLRKTSRADLIKSTETPKTDAKKSSFLADENDVKPKKKGFWG